MTEQFCLRWNNHQSTVVTVVESLLASDSLTDVTLAAEGKYLKAHKLILTACSPYFESVLCQHIDKHPIVILKDVRFYELKAILDYMYKGEVNISQDQLDSFIKTAESLQIKGLTDQGGGGGSGPPDEMVAATPKRKVHHPPTPIQSSVINRPESSPPPGAAPAREGSPTAKRRRRGTGGSQQGQAPIEEVAAPPDAARLSVVPKAEPPETPTTPALPIVKSEALEDPGGGGPGEDIEDLTLDDDDEDYGGGGDSQPGTSYSDPHSDYKASQDFSQWQMTGDRSTDEVFMAAQEAINSQTNSQGASVVEERYQKEGGQIICVQVDKEGFVGFQCFFCQFKSSTISHMRMHYNDRHSPNPTTYECQYCEYTSKRISDLKRHMKLRHDPHREVFSCILCPYKAKQEHTLQKHIKTKH